MEGERIMGITTKDLAQLCGVSRTTVHRALYGGGRIHPDTKEMILRVAKEHDYRPDLLARGLVKGQTYYIGVVVMDVRNRYFAGMLSAIEREAAQHGYNINITLHDNNRKFEQDQLMRLSSYRMDGIILSSVNEGSAYAKFLESLETPIVTVDNMIADGIPFVSIDQRAAMRDAVEHILAMRKYERIVFVCPAMAIAEEQNIYVHRERKKGFEEAMASAPEVQAEYVLNWDYLKRAGELASDGIRTAFACTADDFALDIMKYLKEQGLRTPQNYGIVGFDNVDTLKYITPQLVTVSNKVDAVAKAAVQMLFTLIDAGQENEKEQAAGSGGFQQKTSECAKSSGSQYKEEVDSITRQGEPAGREWAQILPHELIDGETL